MNREMVFSLVGILTISSLYALDTHFYEAQEQELLAEQNKLEQQLQQIMDDQRKKFWSSGCEVTEAAIEAERLRRKEAKFKLESFGGFKFGSWAFSEKLDEAGSRVVEMKFPIRVFDHARLYYTPKHKELWKVVLFGYVDGTTSKEDCYLELAKIMDIVKEKYDVDLTQFLYIGERRFDSSFHKEIGRMDFDGSVYPSGKDKDGRNQIKFSLAVSNFTPFDKEPKKELNISDDKDVNKF